MEKSDTIRKANFAKHPYHKIERTEHSMRNSFQDQLLKLGLVDKKKAGEVKKKQHKQKSQKVARKKTVIDENAEIARKSLEKKKNRARDLNRQREEKLQKREKVARIKQLITEHRLKKDDNGVAYRFTVAGKILRIFVSEEIAGKLGNGLLGIVGQRDEYEVVPGVVVEKIRSIDGSVFTSLAERSTEVEQDPDDPYADYQIPDDLMW